MDCRLREEPCERDRLSSLPNELLINILSLMPTKLAVVVCVLLNKRVLLPWITCLDFDASPISYCLRCRNQIERLPSFLTFVDSFLQAHHSPSLTRFRLDVGVHFHMRCVRASHHGRGFLCDVDCLPVLNFAQINSWISFPLTRCGLRELDLRIHLRGPPSQCQLPPEVFMKETLEVLKLDVNLSFDKVSIFRLLNLKILHLSASLISEDAFLTILVSSCPLLEELKVSAFWNHVRFTKISSPSLRSLSLSMYKLKREDRSDLVVLDTPNLEHLQYFDDVALQYSITSMPRLVKVEISFELAFSMLSPEMNCQHLLILIGAFSNVRHLSLDGACPWNLNCIEKDTQLPSFRDLIYLEMCMISSVFQRKSLMAFLYRSPNLETLVFPRGLGCCGVPNKYCPDWEQELEEQILFGLTLSNASCFKFNLKRIVVYDYRGWEKEIIYIELLLKYALVLEELIIFSGAPITTTVESTLQNLPKASCTCSIQVKVGRYRSFVNNP